MNYWRLSGLKTLFSGPIQLAAATQRAEAAERQAQQAAQRAEALGQQLQATAQRAQDLEQQVQAGGRDPHDLGDAEWWELWTRAKAGSGPDTS